MAIHQLKSPCWELQDPADDLTPHFDNAVSALARLAELKEDDPGTRATVAGLDCRCWLVQCDGECEQLIDEEDEGYIVHCESLQAAGELAKAWSWAYSADGRLIFCEADWPEDAESPPPSPAQQEAAGQLRLPGAIP